MRERRSKIAGQIMSEYRKEREYKEWKERQEKGENYADKKSQGWIPLWKNRESV
jgi:hypothetical protein